MGLGCHASIVWSSVLGELAQKDAAYLDLFAPDLSLSHLATAWATVMKPDNPTIRRHERKLLLCQERWHRYPFLPTNPAYRWAQIRTPWRLRRSELSVAQAVAILVVARPASVDLRWFPRFPLSSVAANGDICYMEAPTRQAPYSWPAGLHGCSTL